MTQKEINKLSKELEALIEDSGVYVSGGGDYDIYTVHSYTASRAVIRFLKERRLIKLTPAPQPRRKGKRG